MCAQEGEMPPTISFAHLAQKPSDKPKLGMMAGKVVEIFIV